MNYTKDTINDFKLTDVDVLIEPDYSKVEKIIMGPSVYRMFLTKVRAMVRYDLGESEVTQGPTYQGILIEKDYDNTYRLDVVMR